MRVLAASAGLVVSRPDVDATGEDFVIGCPGFRGSTRHPKIEVQVKSWSNPAGNDQFWRYRMKATHYNEIAGNDFYLPRFLFVIIVPTEASLYAKAESDALRLYYAGYWASFRDQQCVAGVQTVTVDVPKRNLLTAESLRSLFPGEPATGLLQGSSS